MSIKRKVKIMMRIILTLACLTILFIYPLKSQWVEVSTFNEEVIWDVFFIDSQVGFISGGTPDAPIFLKTRDGGLNWSNANEQIEGFILSINFIGDSTGFLTTGNTFGSWIYRTLDQGNTWNVVSELWINSPGTSFPTCDVGYAIQTETENALITKTIDGGDSWEIINTFSTEWGGYGVKDFQFLTQDTGYMAYESGVVYKTCDGGNSFQQVYLDYHYDLYSMFFLNIDTGYIAGKLKDCVFLSDTCGIVIRTINGGMDWTTDSLPGECQAIQFINSDTGYIANVDEILRTCDGGGTWEVCDGIFWHYMFSLHFPNSSFGYAVGNRLSWNSAVYKLDLHVGINAGPPGNKQLLLFPNPATYFVQAFFQDQHIIRRLIFYNHIGQVVMNTNEVNSPVNISSLPEGLYIVEAYIVDGIDRSKMIIAR